jgi:hypothetical protein
MVRTHFRDHAGKSAHCSPSAAVSTGITLVNKAVFTYNFNGSNALTAAQMLVALILLYFMKVKLVRYFSRRNIGH